MVIILLGINCDIDKMMSVKSLTASSGVEFSKIASQLESFLSNVLEAIQQQKKGKNVTCNEACFCCQIFCIKRKTHLSSLPNFFVKLRRVKVNYACVLVMYNVLTNCQKPFVHSKH